MSAMVSAADVVRRHRRDGAGVSAVTLLVIVVCVATQQSNAWTNAAIALLAATAAMDLLISIRVAGPTNAVTLRREVWLLQWAPLWYCVPMTAAPLLFIEGASRMVDEHAPMPIVGAVLAVSAGAAISIELTRRRLARQLSTPA